MNTYMVTLDTYKTGHKTRHIRAESIGDVMGEVIKKQETAPAYDDYWDGEVIAIVEVEWNGLAYIPRKQGG